MLHVMGNKLFDKDKRLKKFEQELIKRSKEVEGLKQSFTKSKNEVQLNDMAMLANPHTIMETPKHDVSVSESIVLQSKQNGFSDGLQDLHPEKSYTSCGTNTEPNSTDDLSEKLKQDALEKKRNLEQVKALMTQVQNTKMQLAERS